jgi:hypothetical protein
MLLTQLPEQQLSLPVQANPIGWPHAAPPKPQKPFGFALGMHWLRRSPGPGLQQPSGHDCGVQTQLPFRQVTPGGPIWQSKQGPPFAPHVASFDG